MRAGCAARRSSVDEGQDLHRSGLQRRFLRRDAPPGSASSAGCARRHGRCAPEQDVLEHRHVGEGPRDLEGAGEAEGRAGDAPGSPRSLCPASVIDPDVGVRLPARQSNSVVLPAPLGPIRPRISPGGRSNDTPSTADHAAEALGHGPAPRAARRRRNRGAASRLCRRINYGQTPPHSRDRPAASQGVAFRSVPS